MQLNTIFIVLVFVPICFSDETTDEWNKFKRKFKRRFINFADESRRFNLWNISRTFVHDHNLKAKNVSGYFELKLDQDSILSDEEFYKYRTGALPAANPRFFKSSSNIPSSIRAALSNPRIPKSKDWRDDGIVTRVKNQGYCGSCWAFTVAGAIESQLAKRTGHIYDSLSVQLLIDCTRNNRGCQGGYMENAFNYVMNNGINYFLNYPYVGFQTSCAYNPKMGVTNISNYYKTTTESELEALVAHVGPVAVLMYSRFPSFRFYSNGIYYEPECNRIYNRYDHAVLVVGYGTENGIDYWIVKNTWGVYWGEDGYIRIRRGVTNCGIGTYNIIPIL